MCASEILKALSTGSGFTLESISAALNLPIEEVENQVVLMQQAGLCVNYSSGNQFGLHEDLELLDSIKIFDQLESSVGSVIGNIDVLAYISSTNSHLVNSIKSAQINDNRVCLAEYQSGGRGRNGKTWYSPMCSNLNMSIAWRFGCDVGELAGLSLAVGAVVANMLDTQIGLDAVRLKWPNDLMLSNGKLGGILIDVVGDNEAKSCYAVIGIGINVSESLMNANECQYDYSNINSALNRKISRNYLASQILNAVVPMFDDYAAKGFSYYKDTWSKYDLYVGKEVAIFDRGECKFVGVSKGVNSGGEIMIDSHGIIRQFSVGELSLRADFDVARA